MFVFCVCMCSQSRAAAKYTLLVVGLEEMDVGVHILRPDLGQEKWTEQMKRLRACFADDERAQQHRDMLKMIRVGLVCLAAV